MQVKGGAVWVGGWGQKAGGRDYGKPPPMGRAGAASTFREVVYTGGGPIAGRGGTCPREKKKEVNEFKGEVFSRAVGGDTSGAGQDEAGTGGLKTARKPGCRMVKVEEGGGGLPGGKVTHGQNTIGSTVDWR